jgi:predicted ATPase
MIFYMTAVETNQHTTIIFEEPETHSFPPYTRDLAMRIAASETNQFFISTHSPYMLSSLIENLPYDKLNICLTYFKDYQTCVKILSQDETEDLINMSDSAFFNLERFIR